MIEQFKEDKVELEKQANEIMKSLIELNKQLLMIKGALKYVNQTLEKLSVSEGENG